MTIRRLLLAFTLLVLPLSPATGQDWKEFSEAYERGDYATVIELVRPLAERGYAEAQSMLGFMHYHGEGVPQDYADAARWFRGAAEQGYAEAQLNLGLMHYHGEGVPQDYAEAARWYRRAAEQGRAVAQSNFGSMYYHGEGVPQDYAEAARWLTKAAAGVRPGTRRARRHVLPRQGRPRVIAYAWLNLAEMNGDEAAPGVFEAADQKRNPATDRRANRAGPRNEHQPFQSDQHAADQIGQLGGWQRGSIAMEKASSRPLAYQGRRAGVRPGTRRARRHVLPRQGRAAGLCSSPSSPMLG